MINPSNPKQSDTAALESDENTPNLGESAAGTRADVGLVQNDVRLNLYIGKLDEQKPQIERVSAESVVREQLIPSKRDILENIVKYALRGKFDLDSMKVHQIVFDRAGNVVMLEVRVANTDGGNTEIGYVVAGRKFGTTEAFSTSIEWAWTSGEDFTMTESGGVVADYKDGEWVEVL